MSVRNGAVSDSVSEVGGRKRAASKPKSSAQSWRDVLPVHPAADLFPMMSEAELRELGEDIDKNGLMSPIILWSPEFQATKHKQTAPVYLLDGRNRLDAMELVGLDDYVDEVWSMVDHVERVYGPGVDPYAYVLSANIQRRHLTAEQKRELIAKVLKAKPEQSNLQIAKQVRADDKTVAKVRKELESTSEIPKLEKTVGKDGKARKQPAKRKTYEQKSFDSPQEAHKRKQNQSQNPADVSGNQSEAAPDFKRLLRILGDVADGAEMAVAVIRKVLTDEKAPAEVKEKLIDQVRKLTWTWVELHNEFTGYPALKQRAVAVEESAPNDLDIPPFLRREVAK